MTNIKELPPIKESTEDFEKIEEHLKELFKRLIYRPLLRELVTSPKKFLNSSDEFLDAIREGKITFYRGQFSGSFNAVITKELKRLGARWDKKTQTFRISSSSLPREIRETISSSEFMFHKKMGLIDEKLAQILPEKIAEQFQAADLFERTLWKTEKAFQDSVKGITVAPELTDSRRKKIASEWENNLKLHIKDFTQEEISKLRAKMKKAVFTGNRYETMIKSIQTSYGVSAGKAKFLARQETSLLMVKFKESRYTDSGVKEYKWGCVAGSKHHPVRAAHKKLEGKIFSWDNPPITSEPGQPVRRNNPGQDFNCRCFAKPIVRF